MTVTTPDTPDPAEQNNDLHLKAKKKLMRDRKRQFGSDQKMSDLRKPVEDNVESACRPVEIGSDPTVRDPSGYAGINSLASNIRNAEDRLRMTNPPVPGNVHKLDIIDDDSKHVPGDSDPIELPRFMKKHVEEVPDKPTARVIKATPVVIVMAVIIFMLVFIVACQQGWILLDQGVL